MTGLLLALLIIILIVLLVTRAPSTPPPRTGRSVVGTIRRSLFGDDGDYRPRPRAYLLGNLPKSWPIRSVLVQANDEMLAMEQTLASARAVGVPAEIIRSYEANMKQAGRLLNRNSDRIIHASRTGPVSMPLAEALTRKQRGLQHLLDALETARGTLAAVIVTGLDDQRDLDRVARSLQAWSEALGAVSSEIAADLPPLAAPEG